MAASVKGLGGLAACATVFDATVWLIAPAMGTIPRAAMGHHWRDYRGTGYPASITTQPQSRGATPLRTSQTRLVHSKLGK